MLLKLGIIAGIIVIGGVVFSSEIGALFPNTSTTGVDSLKNDVQNLGSQTVDSAEKTIENSFNKFVDKTNDKITDEVDKAENQIKNEISNTKESTQNTIDETFSAFNPIELIKDIFIKNDEI